MRITLQEVKKLLLCVYVVSSYSVAGALMFAIDTLVDGFTFLNYSYILFFLASIFCIIVPKLDISELKECAIYTTLLTVPLFIISAIILVKIYYFFNVT